MSGSLHTLLRSRKFLVLLLDTLLSLLLYFGSKHLGGGAYDDVKYVIGLLQPVALMVIYAIAQEDSAAMRAGLRS